MVDHIYANDGGVALNVDSFGASSTKRKKIWQIESALHCPLVGLCFSRRELRRLSHKKLFSFTPGSSDFQLHRQLTMLVGIRSPQARAVQKILDGKYRVTIQRYERCQDCSALQAQWNGDLEQGSDLAAASWAIFTHPQAESELIDQVYGDCHMKSFEIFARESPAIKRVHVMQQKLACAEAEIEKQMKVFQKMKKEIDSLRQERMEHAEYESLLYKQRTEIEKLQEENRVLRTEKCALQKEQEKFEECAGASFQKEREELLQRIARMEDEAVAYGELLEESEKVVEHMAQKVELAQRQRFEFQTAQVVKDMVSVKMTASAMQQDECENCTERLRGTCEGKLLDGKRVLYVGGLHKMVARYRQMVEDRGGVFLHHDGGVETSKQRLPRMLTGVDAVLCPVDCVSHDACKCLKKMCKKQDKPFVMMRSSGLSSLAKGLGNIMQ